MTLKKKRSERVVKTRCVVSSPPIPIKVRKVKPIMIERAPTKLKERANALITPPYLMSLDSCLEKKKEGKMN